MFAFLMGLKSISPRALQDLIALRQATVIDLNSPQSWARAHVPGALHFDPLAWSEADLPPDKDTRLVFYCSNPMCRKAPNAARRAKKLGYANAMVMAAGITGWLDAGLQTDAGG